MNSPSASVQSALLGTGIKKYMCVCCDGPVVGII